MAVAIFQKKRIQNILPYVLALLFVLLIYGLHMSEKMDSMLNENNHVISHVFLKSQINYHKEIAPFARRPLTTWFIETTERTFDSKPGHAFITVNFFFLFLSGLLIYLLSKKLGASPKQGLMNIGGYFLSFSILFVFFPPVFSYDEPLQYCAILLALIAFIQQKWTWYLLFFTLALIARETTILLLPGLLFFLPPLPKASEKTFLQHHVRLFVVLALPLFFYTVFIVFFIWKLDLLEATKNAMASRYSCFLENFESTKNTVESVTSIFLVLGPFLYLTMASLKGNSVSAHHKKFISAFLTTIAINTPIVIFTAFARESRLFALPLFFIWPMFAQLFGKEIRLLFSYRLYAPLFKKRPYLLAFLILNFLNYLFCFHYYKKLGLGENTYFAEYLFISLLLMSVHFLLWHAQRDRPGNMEKMRSNLPS